MKLAYILAAIVLTAPALYGAQPPIKSKTEHKKDDRTSQKKENGNPGAPMTPGKRVANFAAGAGCAVATVAVGLGLISAFLPIKGYLTSKTDGEENFTDKGRKLAAAIFIGTACVTLYGAYSLLLTNMGRFFCKAFGKAPTETATV